MCEKEKRKVSISSRANDTLTFNNQIPKIFRIHLLFGVRLYVQFEKRHVVAKSVNDSLASIHVVNAEHVNEILRDQSAGVSLPEKLSVRSFPATGVVLDERDVVSFPSVQAGPKDKQRASFVDQRLLQGNGNETIGAAALFILTASPPNLYRRRRFIITARDDDGYPSNLVRRVRRVVGK